MLAGVALPLALVHPAPASAAPPAVEAAETQVRYRSASIDGIDIAYREAGRADAPAILLLHGFPTSSHMFRNLIPALADRYRVIAPDYPGFGQLTSLKATKWQYTHGVPDTSLVSPDTWTHDQALLDRPGNQEIQLDLFYDYRTNVPLYPEWQAYFRKHKPATLVIWGKNDQIFVAEGAAPYNRDLPEVELHLLDAGHFALETNGPEMARLIRDFLGRKVAVEKAEQ
jgi:pimeloyl-ACP methyl ester carboxylesterase